MKEFLDYDVEFPNLPLFIICYFDLGCNPKVSPAEKSIQGFMDNYKTESGKTITHPEIILKICNILRDKGRLIELKGSTPLGLQNNYISTGVDIKRIKSDPTLGLTIYNSLVYGFDYIYKTYLPRVKPLMSRSTKRDSLGTCFRLFDGLVTARHCIEDGDRIAIKGYDAEQLNSFKVFTSKDPNIDLAFIRTNEEMISTIDEPHVLDEILVMGYPKVPLFLNFCTAEKATVSSIADLRMTPTRGDIVAIEKLYYPTNHPELMLITAKICGGNSGGPVINNEGVVVGVTTGTPMGEGHSVDNVGYGIAYPIDNVINMIDEQNIQEVTFFDFPED